MPVAQHAVTRVAIQASRKSALAALKGPGSLEEPSKLGADRFRIGLR